MEFEGPIVEQQVAVVAARDIEPERGVEALRRGQVIAFALTELILNRLVVTILVHGNDGRVGSVDLDGVVKPPAETCRCRASRRNAYLQRPE